MLSFLFFVVLGAIAEHATANECESGWIDAAHVGMGCLYFDSASELSWLDAVKHCQDKKANLVEIFTDYQHDFVRMELDMVDDQDPKYWWTGGNDIRREGYWMWLVSFASVDDFIWKSGEPNDGIKGNCLQLSPYDYHAADYPCTAIRYPICQKFI